MGNGAIVTVKLSTNMRNDDLVKWIEHVEYGLQEAKRNSGITPAIYADFEVIEARLFKDGGS